MSDLRTPTHNGHLLAEALRRHRRADVVHIGDRT